MRGRPERRREGCRLVNCKMIIGQRERRRCRSVQRYSIGPYLAGEGKRRDEGRKRETRLTFPGSQTDASTSFPPLEAVERTYQSLHRQASEASKSGGEELCETKEDAMGEGEKASEKDGRRAKS